MFCECFVSVIYDSRVKGVVVVVVCARSSLFSFPSSFFHFFTLSSRQSLAVYMAKRYPRCQPRVGVSCKFVSSIVVSWREGV